uniref:Uncharacterized protein n=1 Tax=Strigamia maritima TaxID=126957 RepID=T1IVJ7_STRMM
MYRSLSFICLLMHSLSVGADDAKTAAMERGFISTEQPYGETHPENQMLDEIEKTPDDETEELAMMRRQFAEADDPVIAEYMANRFPRMGDKAKRIKRYLPFANDDLGNFMRFSPDENINEYLRDQPSMEVNDDQSESIESTGDEKEFLNMDVDHDTDYGSLEDDLMKANHPGMRRLHQYYEDDDLDEDEEIDEEKLFANQFPSLEEMKAKGRFDMDELYQKLAHHRPHDLNSDNMPRPTRSKLRGKQPATTKKEAEVKKPVVDSVVSTRKRPAPAPLPVVSPPKTRKKGKNAKSPVKKQSASASNQTSPKKKKNESVQDKVEEIGETSRSTRSTRTLKKVPVLPLSTPPTKKIRTRSMLRKRAESPKKKAMAETTTVKSPQKTKTTTTKPQSKVKTKAKKVVIKKTSPQKGKPKTNTRKTTSQKSTEIVEKIEPKVQQRRRSTQRSEVAKTPAEKKSVTSPISRPRRRMLRSAEDDKKEEETQMEKTEDENDSAEETKPKDETDVSTTTESKIDDPQEQTKADHHKEQTEMEVVETDDDAGKGKRKLEDGEKEENDAKKTKVDETDKGASLKEDEEMDLDKEGKANNEKETEGKEKSNEKPSALVVDEGKEKDEVKVDVDEKPVESEPVEKEEEKEEKSNDVAANDTEKEKDSVAPTTNQQNNCQAVTETPPEKLLAAEDAITEDEAPVENSTPTTNGIIYETKEVPVMIGRRKLVQNARSEEKKEETAAKHKFSVATYNLQGVEEDKVKQDVEELEADIVCFQQVDSDYYTNKLQPHLKSLGYVGFHHEGNNEQKGLAMFCKTATFEFVDKKECDVYQLVKKDIEEKNLEEKSKEILQSFLNKSSSSALYIKLKSVGSQKTMSVCNTSLTPTDHGMHALQLAVLVRELLNQSEGTANPHLLCGTLNLEENQPGLQVLKDGYLNDESISCLQVCKNVPIQIPEKNALVDLLWTCFQHSSSGFKSSYNVLSKENAPLNNKNSVWHSSDSLRVMGVLDLEVEGNKETCDAIPLYVQFDFN